MSDLKVGDTVYSLDDLTHGYHEEATVVEVNRYDDRPEWAPRVTYTVQTKSGGTLHFMLRSELSTTKPIPLSLPAIASLGSSLDAHGSVKSIGRIS